MWVGGGMWDVRGRSEHRDAHGFCEVGHTRENKILTVSLVCIFYILGCAYVVTSFLKNKSLL